jgi:hypothetical protein
VTPKKEKKEEGSVFDDLLDTLKDDKEQEAEVMEADEWDLDSKGSALRGIFISAERKPTSFGSGYEVLVRDVDTDLLMQVWCLRGSLRDAVRKAAPKVGTEIVFVNNGQQEGRTEGRDWWWYQVKASESNQVYWDALDKVQPDEVRKSIEEADRKRATSAESYDENEAPF